MMDGVYQIGRDGAPAFHPVPAPTDEDVADIAAAVCRRIERKLARTLHDPDADPLAAREPLLASLAGASVAGLVATGPRRGLRLLQVGGRAHPAQATVFGRRCAEVGGYNLHANVHIAANDIQGLDQLCRYLARPPIAGDRLKLLEDGNLMLELKRRFDDGTAAVVFTPGELIEKLIPLVLRPRRHAIRFHGLLAPAAGLRSKIVPSPESPAHGSPAADLPANDAPRPREPPQGPHRIPWAALLARIFKIDVLDCPKCHGRMWVVAAVMERQAVARVLAHLGLPTEPPRILPARAPPQYELSLDYADPPASDDFPT